MDIIGFLLEAGRLKEVRRTGWIAENIPGPESVADHSFGTALLAYLLGSRRKGLDVDKAVRMALIHDLAESRVGDILVDWKVELYRKRGIAVEGKHHGVSPAEKHAIEREAMESLATDIPNGQEVLGLWLEFEQGKTPEACFVRDMDRFDMLLQALRYEREGRDLGHWLQEPRNAIQDPELRTLFKRLLEIREGKGR